MFFTATVASITGAVPTGTVTFSIDGQAQAPVTLAVVDGQDEASLPAISDLGIGDHTITAAYNGDDTFGFSTANPLTQSVTAATAVATITVLASSVNPSNPGQSVVFTAAVTPITGEGMPTGTVTFSIDGQAQTPITLTVVDGQDEASLPPISDLAIGDHTITAVYNGDDTFAMSTATPLIQSVAAVGTTTVLVSSANPSNPGQSVTFTATVAPITGEGTPTGTVTFSIDGQAQALVTLGLVDGQDLAVLAPISNLSAGDHTITATYSGDDTFAVSTATPVIQSVAALATATTLSSSANPSAFGQSVTFTATVAPTAGTSTPTGTVTFSIDGDTQAPVTLMIVDGQDQASLPPNAVLSGGSHTVTAVYNGDNAFAASTATPLIQVVSPIATTTQLTTSLNPSLFNQSVTFKATVTPVSSTIPPAGSVTFLDGPNVIDTESLDSSGAASFTTSTLALGLNTITAVYTGNSDFDSSTSPAVNQTVQVDTTTTLAMSPNPANGNQSVTLTASVAPTAGAGTATGEVEFIEAASIIGTGPLLNGVATFVAASFSIGADTITRNTGATGRSSRARPCRQSRQRSCRRRRA